MTARAWGQKQKRNEKPGARSNSPLATRIPSLVLRLLLLAFVAALGLVGLTGCDNPLRGKPTQQHELPVEIKRLVLDTWTPLSAKEIGEEKGKDNVIDLEGELDLDGDGDKEWLYLYRYNAGSGGGPIGGVIFDTQMITHQMELPTPYPPILSFIPYRLLPDLVDEYKSTGGYLGESRCTVEFYDTDENGQADELAILGHSNTPYPTHLSIFRWKDKDSGYEMVWHIQGNGGLNLTRSGEAKGRLYPGFIKEVTVTERVDARFPVAIRETWRRPSKEATYYRVEEPHLDFVFGPPGRPFYPEEAVLKYYLSRQLPKSTADQEQIITGTKGSVSAQAFQRMKEGFSDPMRVPPGYVTRLHLPRAQPSRYTGPAQTDSAGRPYPLPRYADVDMDVVTADGPRTLRWRVVNTAKEKPNEDPEWKVVGVQEVPR